MFDLEITYRTKLGGLTAVMTTSERVATRAEADELREKMRAVLSAADATFKIKNAPVPPTVDEAVDRLVAEFRRFPPIGAE